MEEFRNDHLVLERFEVGPFLVNSYIVGCLRTQQAAIVDPGDEGERILERCWELNLSLKYILNTHGHADHIADNDYLKKQTNAPIVIHPLDAPMLTDARLNMSALFGMPLTSPPADLYFNENEVFQLGDLNFNILHIPGHSRGSVCLIYDSLAIVGDVLFSGSIGRTDFPGGSYEQLVNGINRKLIPLGDEVQVFPGHGPATTIREERLHNPFLTGLIP